MPFEKEPVKTPTRIECVTLHLAVLKAADGTLTYLDTASVGVVMSDGTSRERVINPLRDHLTAAQKTSVRNLLDVMLAKAETEIL